MSAEPRPAGSDAPIRVLFLCTGNSARSQIAEALLQEQGRGRFVVGSAGTHPAARVHPDAVALLAERGIDWSGRRPKTIEEVADQPWDVIITVCDSAKESCPVMPGRPVLAHWGVEDPAHIDDPARRRAAFRHAASVLGWRIGLLLALRPEAVRALAAEHLRLIGTAFPPADDRSEPAS